MKWLAAEGSRRAHALRESSRVAIPSVRMSMCGRVAWHRHAVTAPEDMLRCGSCLAAMMRRATL